MTNEAPAVDFGEDGQRGPSTKNLADLSTLAERSIKEEAEVVRLSNELLAAYRKLQKTLEEEIPELMRECKVSDYSLLNGQKVRVRDHFIGNKLTNEEGLAYVEANEGGDAIKTIVSVELPKGMQEVATRLLQKLKDDPAANHFLKSGIERYVHQSTIASFAKSQVEAGKQPPLDKLGVVRKHIAKVGNTRTKSLELKGFDYK